MKKLLTAVLALALAAPAIAADEPGTFKIPGTETTLKLNGYIQFDVTYDFDGATDDIRGTDWASFLATQPLDDDADQKDQPNRLYMTARTSRIGISTSTPVGGKTLVTRMEGDFNHPAAFNFSTEPTTNGMDFRLRHAYGEYGGLLIGQTWTNFMDGGSLPDTVDFNGHGAFAAIRTPMIRYAMPVGPGSLGVSLENPQSIVINTDIISGDSLTVGRRYDRIPAVTASLTIPFSMGHVNVRGVAHEYQGAQGTGTAGAVKDSKFGWGGGVSGSLKFGPELVVWSVQGGDGLGYYTFQSLLQGAGFVGDSIETWKHWTYHVGLTHNWSDKARSNIIWTQTFYSKNDDLAATLGTLANKEINALYVNTFVSPMKNTELGIEYNYGARKIFESQVTGGNDTGTQHRVNALARYTFF